MSDKDTIDTFRRTGWAVFEYRRETVLTYAAVFLILGIPPLLLPVPILGFERRAIFLMLVGVLLVGRGIWILRGVRGPAVVLNPESVAVRNKLIPWVECVRVRLQVPNNGALPLIYLECKRGRVKILYSMIENADTLLQCLEDKLSAANRGHSSSGT